jgi:hypothetical protein
MNQPSVYDCAILPLKKVHNRSGNITIVEGKSDVPFDLKRVFYTYDIPGGEDRGAHAHKKCHQILIAASGSFNVELDDGVNKRIITLNRPDYGLHILPGIWASQKAYSSGAICLVLASHTYDESDYIRDYQDFISYKQRI